MANECVIVPCATTGSYRTYAEDVVRGELQAERNIAEAKANFKTAAAYLAKNAPTLLQRGQQWLAPVVSTGLKAAGVGIIGGAGVAAGIAGARAAGKALPAVRKAGGGVIEKLRSLGGSIKSAAPALKAAADMDDAQMDLDVVTARDF